MDAEYGTQQWTRPVVAGEWSAMRAALENRYGMIEGKLMPAKEVVEKKLAEVEAGEQRAEELERGDLQGRGGTRHSYPDMGCEREACNEMRGNHGSRAHQCRGVEEEAHRVAVWHNTMVMVAFK